MTRQHMGAKSLDYLIEDMLVFQDLASVQVEQTLRKAVGGRDMLIAALLYRMGGQVTLNIQDVLDVQDFIIMETQDQETGKWVLELERAGNKNDSTIRSKEEESSTEATS